MSTWSAGLPQRMLSRFAVRVPQPFLRLGFLLVALVCFGAIFAPWLSPYEPNRIAVLQRLQGPTLAHWLGTDQLGRDLFSRTLAGSRIALFVAVTTIGISLVIGTALGLLAGYGPRWLDAVLILICDSMRSFPVVMFGLAVATIFGPSLQTVMLIIVVFTVPAYARIVRAQTSSLKRSEFIVAERALGARAPQILLRHILPNLAGPLLILASMDVPSVITVEAGLSFLGLGLRPPAASWGNMLNEGYTFVRDSDWPIIAAGLPLVMTTLGFTFLAEDLRDRFDPRLRKGRA